MEIRQSKLAVLFPGIGYTCDRPLLYYTGRLLQGMGYQIIPLRYGGFPANVRGDLQKMHQCLVTASEQAEQYLHGTNLAACEEIVFVGKSVGTLVALQYARQHDLKTRNILLTPVKETFRLPAGEAIVLHGTADPWADTEDIPASCQTAGIPLHLFQQANHSLETGNLQTDLSYLREAIHLIRIYLTGR